MYFAARGFSEFSYQIAAVAVGWQLYALTNSPFALGMVGLVQFIPTALLTLVAGHVADRYDRKRVVQICQFAEALTAAFLAWGSFAGWLGAPGMFAAVAIFGVAVAFESPAAAALLPGVTPEGMLQGGTAFSTGALQAAAISGPALGGLAYAAAPGAPYAMIATFWLLAGLLNGAIKLDRLAKAEEPPTLADLFTGVGFVRRNPAILGSISLDLFAVLLGGATALLPIYARDILHTGPWGLGVLAGRASRWRAADDGGAGPSRDQSSGGDADVPSGHRLRPGDIGVRPLALDLDFNSRLGRHGRCGYGQGGDSHSLRAVGYARRDARAGERGELPVRQRLLPARRIRKRRYCGPVRRNLGSRAGVVSEL